MHLADQQVARLATTRLGAKLLDQNLEIRMSEKPFNPFDLPLMNSEGATVSNLKVADRLRKFAAELPQPGTKRISSKQDAPKKGSPKPAGR
ncbi:hypothetical protein FJ987_25810 [Mesorhizobium sp. CU2]|uniref:hypothetical protein n=1 Tax=unclassified Mesorhizobium TaxID=325217 RepID=UPI001127073A|nr:MULTISPECIES: hypothetical protein [unclassified Mesorhizobium]TPN81047.1 hypothetical protein FJ988_19305 [Mesorhizobium sp. CU3]TPO05735.1 hypothetical protein FJ987_25810 [Mesorhizobium sp. CU2]